MIAVHISLVPHVSLARFCFVLLEATDDVKGIWDQERFYFLFSWRNMLFAILAHELKNELMQWPVVVRPSVCLSVCKLLRKSLLLAGKWPDRHQTFTRWTPGQLASRMCSRSRSRSKVTWYAHFFGFLEWATPSLTVWLNSLLWHSCLVTCLLFHGCTCSPYLDSIIASRVV